MHAVTIYGMEWENFHSFSADHESFPLESLAVYTVHDGHGLMHHKNFPVNSVFCAQPQKFCRIQYIESTAAYLFMCVYSDGKAIAMHIQMVDYSRTPLKEHNSILNLLGLQLAPVIL